MNENRLFFQTRWRIATSYAIVMGLILGLCGLGFYQAIVHAHWQTLDRELEIVAGTLHDSVENTLKQPGRLEPATQELLPEQMEQRHVLGAIHQDDYYIRFLDRFERTIAVAGLQPEGLPFTSAKASWHTPCDTLGNCYHQISLTLHTQDNIPWGYMQMGRSLRDINEYLANVKLILLLGLPIATMLVGGSSWWLASIAMQPIYQSYKQIQQFTADAAHELRTPLAAARATVESALRTAHTFNPEIQEILQTIERQNHRLTQLVADLLLLAHMERRTPLRTQICCLNDIVNDLIEELAALAIAAEITLFSDIRVYKLLYVTGDEEQLYRLVSNLIINAVQYTLAGGKVTVILERSDHHALIRIQDTGIGIAAKEQKRIFTRFYRVNSDRSRASGGSGLGLAIAQAIVQAHKGNLTVQSELGKGSTFIIRLPLRVTSSKSENLNY